MAFDFKKEYKELYLPKTTPSLVEVPPMRCVAVPGSGDPNQEGGAYQQAVSALYAIAYTIRMSYKGGRQIEGFFEYVVPPLEGFWWQEGQAGVDYRNKAGFQWISLIRLPDFVAQADFDWAVGEAERKKGVDCSRARLMEIEEGLCVQILHLGSYDSEPESIARMDRYLAEKGYENDLSEGRRHHEIYLSDPRKAPPEKWKTVIRHPVRPR